MVNLQMVFLFGGGGGDLCLHSFVVLQNKRKEKRRTKKEDAEASEAVGLLVYTADKREEIKAVLLPLSVALLKLYRSQFASQEITYNQNSLKKKLSRSRFSVHLCMYSQHFQYFQYAVDLDSEVLLRFHG